MTKPPLLDRLGSIEATFEALGNSSFTKGELGQFYNHHRLKWNVPQDVKAADFINFMVEKSRLREEVLMAGSYQPITRFVWGSPSPYQVLMSIRKGGYFSHETAAFLHSLVRHQPNRLFLNKEQSPKQASEAQLSQEAVDRAFGNKQRESQYIFKYRRYDLVILSGKATNKLGVVSIVNPSGEQVPVTNIERTLIDIAVRPQYAGGPIGVLSIYKAARGSVSIKELVEVLRKLDYRYPYHQAIGFYLKRAGYDQSDLAVLSSLGVSLNFYLSHGLSQMNREFDGEWGIFYPKELDL